MKKKILIVLYYYHPYVSGLSVLAKNIAENLDKSKFEVTVLTTKFDNSLSGKEVISGVTVIRTPVLFKLSKGVISPLFFLKTILLAKKHDIVNFHLPIADAGLSVFFIPKKKIITQYHCDLNLKNGLLDKCISWLSYLLMDITLFKSKKNIVSTLDYFSHSKLNKYLNKSIQIYPPVDTDKFFPQPYNNLLTKLSISKKIFKIGFVGRIVQEKGLEYLLESINYLQSEIEDFVIIIVGDYKNIAGGSIKSSLNKYIEKFPGRIIFTGYINDSELISFYSMIDILVLPSIDPLESFGLVQIEAMLCGTPVIASDMPGVREIIMKTGNGFLSIPKNSKNIGEQIVKLHTNPITVSKESLGMFLLSKSIKRYQDVFGR